MDDGLLIIPSYSNRTMSNDVDYEFRQQSDLLYLTGFPEPDTTAVLEKNGDELKYVLFVPKRDPEFEIWNGKRFGVDGARQEFLADEAYENGLLEEKLSELLPNYERVYYLSGENKVHDDLITQLIHKGLKSREKKGRGPVQVINPINEIHELRLLKSEAEITLLEKSAQISAEAMKLAMEVTKPGLTERQIEAVIEFHYAKNDCDRPAYPSIVGSGANATILHYIENNATLKDGDLLLIDAGAEYKGYAADITRTWPINGRFNDAQKKVYDLVLNTELVCIEMVRPGVIFNDLQDKAVQLLSEGLLNLDLLQGDLDVIIEEKKYRRYFMHGIGHWLGHDVHDTGMIGRDKMLAENQYFTVEPGIYIPEDEDIHEEFRGIGVRIEDDVQVTENGYRILSDQVPKDIPTIEQLVGTKNIP